MDSRNFQDIDALFGGVMYRNVMVPVDGSSFSREAVLQGLRIASQNGATLRLVRVASGPVLFSAPETLTLSGEAAKQLRASELASLYMMAAECRAHSTVNVTASLEQGPVTDALIGYARRFAVDLIVMRSHARRGLARVWFGSIADQLIRESGIPVLVVRPPSVATALENGFQYKRILVPLDGSELAEQSLASAVALAQIGDASITLLRVVSSSSQVSNGELESGIGPAPQKDVMEAQRYLGLLPVIYGQSVPVSRRVVVSDDVAGTILQVAECEEADLIAIATRGRGAFARAAAGSVSDRVMREAPVSALVVHPIERAVVSRPVRVVPQPMAV